MAVRELLGQCAAEAVAQHVHLPEPELVQEPAVMAARRGNLRGQRGVADSPVPGASKVMTVRPGRRVISGSHISMFAPTPLMRSSGGPVPVTWTRSRCRSTVTKQVVAEPRAVGGSITMPRR